MKQRIRGKVFGSLSPGTINIHVGYGYGLLDGGFFATFETEKIPKECRMPNSYLWITLENQKLVKVEKMTSSEIEDNLLKWGETENK
jgi:hypothetical protein